MNGTTVGPQTGTCVACGLTVPIVNYTLVTYPASRNLPSREEGYLARHTRPKTRAGSKCRGSFGAWRERRGGKA